MRMVRLIIFLEGSNEGLIDYVERVAKIKEQDTML